MASDVKLKPGWLTRDILRAAQRTSEWERGANRQESAVRVSKRESSASDHKIEQANDQRSANSKETA